MRARVRATYHTQTRQTTDLRLPLSVYFFRRLDWLLRTDELLRDAGLVHVRAKCPVIDPSGHTFFLCRDEGACARLRLSEHAPPKPCRSRTARISLQASLSSFDFLLRDRVSSPPPTVFDWPGGQAAVGNERPTCSVVVEEGERGLAVRNGFLMSCCQRDYY